LTIALAVGAFGALIGSFLNVVVHRVPARRSVVSPPSACGACGHAIRPYDNIPIVSWLVLRGRCRDCRAPISPRYPLVELATALVFAIVAWVFAPAIIAATTPTALAAAIVQLVAYLYLAAISIALALIDLDTRRLPNVLVVPSYVVGGVLLTLVAALTGEWVALATAGLGLAIWGGLYFALAVIWPGGMGFGDVKLAGVLGLFLGFLGWPTLGVGMFAGFLAGGVFGVALMLAGRGRKAAIAFGPWMLLGAWVGILGGPAIFRAYLGLLGLAL
tara:strand:- start:37496 stop:38317 length:822 start_codon:yes stop_codon:yes gene_type:complete